ncbi:hypothetical protein ABB37_03147 [Leptomonas pyrrhocoris]|uniref:Uncharacterized protein n=1 Tax=Leptomonas pyrrhocoris TaxID=157538 RepID=A0A0M9G3Z9_LEPPY|nr:hypothetical protein ABB37_03147 [Leptomonas pyrrhocoris]KPA81960.1 hypothetical protein ABB37_03147 [Leptomonas pyrrhocoris]|eukprot:XP_015660399.1 hypothetical protein ABB37_03147 [Leptomonas pyrrhocoris]
MASTSSTLESLAKWTASEKTRQERLYAVTVAEESLLLHMLEESMMRERLEQRFRHERALIELNLEESAPQPLLRVSPHRDALSRLCLTALDKDEPLPFDSIDRLTNEEVEQIWQKEKRKLQQKILSVSDRVRKLCK